MDLKSIKPVYLVITAIAIVCIIAVLHFGGFAQAVSEKTYETSDTAWDVLYLGLLTSEATQEERQERVDTFIEHNAGASDACTIMHFYSNTCPACMQLEPWLNEFKEWYPEVLITSYEAHEDGYQAQRESANNEYGTDTTLVPTIYVCGTVLQGVAAIENAFEPMALAVYNLPIRYEHT